MTDLELKLAPLVDAIKEGKKVAFFNGAGISTAAGIPDFRSPNTGLYANLAKLDLPYAEAVFDIDYFKENPKPFYTLAEELYPGKFPPTKFHHFIKLLQDRDQLHRVYTQNIDTLERLAGVKDEFIIEAHGSFANNHCVDCSEEMDTETLKAHMRDKQGKQNGIPTCTKCNGYVKPDIVFFGEGLPKKFFTQWDQDCDQIEVAIVAGTSLTVHPFASLPSDVGKKGLRVLVNKDRVGDLGRRKSDILALHECDHVAETLATLLGWDKELNKLYGEFGKGDPVESVDKAKNKAEESPKKEGDLKATSNDDSKGTIKEAFEKAEDKVKEDSKTHPVTPSEQSKESEQKLAELVEKLKI
ncbi:uncharacterized protein LODBEIA_P09630 [Lodderomyces beijingensis]|uniref:NAD-dependent protein deacetylase n=1 Tax=Lodderomyces beijingensis TaxID=1775926 RepID=A0ABP0ZFX5_9ASCO